jgi:hypothetical protein
MPASQVLVFVGTILAERLLYIPSIGFCLVVAYLAEAFLEPGTRRQSHRK